MAKSEPAAVVRYRELRERREALEQRQATSRERRLALIQQLREGNLDVAIFPTPTPAATVAFENEVAAALGRPRRQQPADTALAEPRSNLQQVQRELEVLATAITTLDREQLEVWRAYSSLRYEAEFRQRHEALARELVAAAAALLRALAAEQRFVERLDRDEKVQATFWGARTRIEPREGSGGLWRLCREAVDAGLLSSGELAKLERDVTGA